MPFFPNQDSGPFFDLTGANTNGAESFPLGVIHVPANFFGEIEARVHGAAITTGDGGGDLGYYKRRLTIEVHRNGAGSIVITGAEPAITFADATPVGSGFNYTFQPGDLPGDLKLVVQGLDGKNASHNARVFMSGCTSEYVA